MKVNAVEGATLPLVNGVRMEFPAEEATVSTPVELLMIVHDMPAVTDVVGSNTDWAAVPVNT